MVCQFVPFSEFRAGFRAFYARQFLIGLSVINILALMDIAVACGIFLFKLHRLNNYFAFEAITHVVVGVVARNYLPTLQW